MKIKLISPGQLDARGKPIRLHRELIPGLTLPYLAALFPAGHEIEIIEEGLEPLDYDAPVDLVGITAMTARAPRAYQIADRFKQRGVPVVMGGFHVSARPQEALAHCDAVVQGEAEGLMDRIVSDSAEGKLQGIYKNETWHDLQALPTPRYDLLRMENYISPFYPIQASRGCPNQCEFCSVAAFYGRRYRKRPIADVIADMQRAGAFLFIVDDNLPIDRDYALELFARMKPLHKIWGGQFNLAAANDPELVQAAADSGCIFLYIGVESVDPINLVEVGKRNNVNVSAQSAIHNLKRHHIDPLVSIIVGFDYDDFRTARQIIQFCNNARVSLLLLYILTPLPGSPLYTRLSASGMMLSHEWYLYDGTHAVIDRQKLKAEQIESMYAYIYQRVYSFPSIVRRTLVPPHFLILLLNIVFRGNLKNALHPWMGTKVKKDIIRRITPVAMKILTHPRARQLSRIIRYAEGRTIS